MTHQSIPFSPAQVIAALPLIWFLIERLDKSYNAGDKYEADLAKSDMKRNKGKKMQAKLSQSFKFNLDGASEVATASIKYPGFGLVEPRITLEFLGLGMKLANSDKSKEQKTILHGVSGKSRSLPLICPMDFSHTLSVRTVLSFLSQRILPVGKAERRHGALWIGKDHLLERSVRQSRCFSFIFKWLAHNMLLYLGWR